MITAERRVQADPDQVWGLVGDLLRWAEMLPTVDKISAKSTGPSPVVGSRYAVKQPGLPVMVYEITEWSPGRSFAWSASAPGVRTLATHSVQPTAEGCVLTLGLHWEGPLAPVVERLYGRRTDSYVQQEADTFARLGEQRDD